MPGSDPLLRSPLLDKRLNGTVESSWAKPNVTVCLLFNLAHNSVAVKFVVR